jgi:hypothetical protein
MKCHVQGPLKLGDPFYRGLTKMEEDPVITQRMRDVSRVTLCAQHVKEFEKCGKDAVFIRLYFLFFLHET